MLPAGTVLPDGSVVEDKPDGLGSRLLRRLDDLRSNTSARSANASTTGRLGGIAENNSSAARSTNASIQTGSRSSSLSRSGRSSGTRRARRRSIEGVGLYEGGGYQSKGVWRGAEDCRMRTNSAPVFCPVCQQAITDIIDFYTTD